MKIIYFFFNDTATTEIYTLSLHDALPICKSEDIFPDVRAANSAGRIELSKVGHGITHTVRLT